MWYDVADVLDPSIFTLHMLDFRGCGLSDRPMGGHDLLGYVADARAALASIEAPVTIAAHSMGGKIAQYLASEHPANLERMVLVAPGTASGGRATERQREAAIGSYGSRDRIEAFQRSAMSASVPFESMQRVVEDALLAQREHWIGWYDNGRFADFHERLSRIRVPSLCIAGAKDPLIPPSRARREVAQAIAGCVFVTLHNAGHNLPVEAPQEIAGAVTRFA
jgi:pimeloyl-ACP methyl ester carboxylesterase